MKRQLYHPTQGDVSLQELVDGLNAIGVGARQTIAILQAIKAAGALHADLGDHLMNIPPLGADSSTWPLAAKTDQASTKQGRGKLGKKFEAVFLTQFVDQMMKTTGRSQRLRW